MNQAAAWILQVAPGLSVAIGLRELVQLIDGSDIYQVPMAPDYCSEVLFWQKRAVPVLDLHRRLQCSTPAGAKTGSTTILALLAYENLYTRAVEVGAVYLPTPPKKVIVNDNQASMPDAAQLAQWGQFAVSSFDHEGSIVPVLDLSRIFTAETAATLGKTGNMPPLYLNRLVA